MADRTLAQRVAALERQMEGKTLQQHFREHAELFERLLVYYLEEFASQQDAKWDTKLDIKLAALDERQDAKLAAMEMRLDAKWDSKLAALEDRQDAKLVAMEMRLDAKWDTKLDIKLAALDVRQDAKLAAMEMRLDAKWDTRSAAIENLAREILSRLS